MPESFKGNNIAHTKYGTYVGVTDTSTGTICYRGITYAVAERFQAPKAPDYSDKLIPADKNGNAPIQVDCVFNMGNDCLNLNIWTADNDIKNKSVYMYIYGGAQIKGSNQEPDWTGFVAKNPDIIVVMPNYRVGFWGSIDLSQLGGYDKVEDLYKYSNNLARVDLLQCLKWIRENIGAFGGNPEDVTLGGQSAGSNNITCLMMMDEANKYFQKAICQSSFSLDISLQTLETAKIVAADLFKRLGVTTVEEFIAKSDEEILQAEIAIFASSANGSSAYTNIESKFFCAVIDGVVIPENYFEYLLSGNLSGKRFIFGTNEGEYDQQYTDENGNPHSYEDALDFTVRQNWGKLSERGWNAANAEAVLNTYLSHNKLYGRDSYTAAKDLKNDLFLRCSGILFAETLCRQNEVYMYYNKFDTNPGSPTRTAHGSEIVVVARDWSTLKDLFASDPNAEATASMLSNTWASFIRSGDPNNKSLPVKWEPYCSANKNTLEFCSEPCMSKGIRRKDVELLLPLLREYPMLQLALEGKVSKPGVYNGYTSVQYNGFNRYSRYVAVSDGTKLAVDYYIPVKDGVEEKTPLPAVWEFTPYSRVSYKEDGTLLIDTRVSWFTSYGYVVARVDCRGMGASFGFRDAASSPWEAQDGHDINEWLATQPFCNGKTGMFGMSYTGQTQYLTISKKPKHLVCAVVGCTDFNKYDGWVRGGIPRAFGSTPDTLWKEIGGDVTIESVVASTVPVDEDPDKIMLFEAISQHVKNGLQVPMMQNLLWRNSYSEAVNGEYWNMVSASTNNEAINSSGVAIYILGGLYDVFRRDTVIAYKNITVPKKMTIGPWYHVEPKIELSWPIEQLRWFDYWLKNIDNGIMDEPPIFLKTENAENDWNFHEDWPLNKGEKTTFFLMDGIAGTKDGLLSPVKPEHLSFDDNKAVYGFTTGAASVSSAEIDDKGLTYTTTPMTDDFEITGHPTANISLELLTEGYKDIDVFITLIDYDPMSGNGFIFSEGHLRSSLRGTDNPPYDFLGLPWHPSNKEDEKYITTGHVYDLLIDLLPTSYVIKKGHSLRLTVTNSLDCFYYLGRSEFETNPEGYSSPCIRLYKGGDRASTIVLPNIYKK